MNSSSPKSITLLSLITVIVTAGAFKEEMSGMYLWSGSWSLLIVFIAFALFYGILLLCYLILEMSSETPGFKFLSKYSPAITRILNSIFLLSLTIILLFSLATLLLAALVFAPIAITVLFYIIFTPVIYKQLVGLIGETKKLIVIIRQNKEESKK